MCKMSSKLIIHKFESGVNNFKSLLITVKDVDNEVSEAIFSEWLDGTTKHKVKDSEKCLVVKIVPDIELHDFNLELCAKEVTGDQLMQTNIFFATDYEQQIPYNQLHNADNTASESLLGQTPEWNNHFVNYAQTEREQIQLKAHLAFDNIRENSIALQTNQRPEITDEEKTPLEYSLEKVQENNAKIMENIHILNRTLNYTKKKEFCPRSMRSYPCNMCDKCFVYETGLKRHYSLRHKMTEIQPRWQVVWTCIECFQVWPRQDLALRHSSQCCKSDNIDCVREIKTSSLLQCEFCEKVFTSIPRLLRHSKTHTTENNYECNACETTFVSFRTAEQHWSLCPWLKMCYNFSLPKLLLCDVCDRKFRNYEQLYNHRYKVGHLSSKYHGTKNLWNPLVYQCEVCGQWFTLILSLHTHRAQCHSMALESSVPM